MAAISVTTANVCGNPLRPKAVVRRRMRRALRIAGVTFGQEIARSNRWRRGNYASAWRAVAWGEDKHTFGTRHEVPISLDLDIWDVQAHDTEKAHEGKAHVSPARYITWVAAKRHTGEQVAFVDCHPPSKPRRGVPFSRWRIEHWNIYFDLLCEIVERLSSESYTVVFGGDMNKRRRAIPQVHRDQRLLVSSGLDHLWVVPAAGATVRIRKPRKVRRTVLMDHPILTGRFYLHA